MTKLFFEFRNPHSNECELNAKDREKVEKLFLRKSHLQDTASEVNPNRIHFQDTVAEVNPSRLRLQDTVAVVKFYNKPSIGDGGNCGNIPQQMLSKWAFKIK